VFDPTDRLLDLLAREGSHLHALLMRLTLDAHAAEDLMQELFVKVATGPAFRSARNPTAYLRQAAIHQALDWRRNRRRHATLMDRLPESPDPAPAALDRAAQHEQWQRILDAAADLPGLTREAFFLHYLQQQTHDEVAAHLGKTAHQVRGLCHKAISQLRLALGVTPGATHEEDSHAIE